MNKTTLVWTLVVAVPVGIAALTTAYVYRDTGKLPFQNSADSAMAPETGAESAQPLAAAQAPEASQAETAEAASVGTDTVRSAARGPSFDVVGVEPTGETVVAGRSDAGAIVALTANGKVVGKSIANEAGEWTIILDEPLKPGDYDVGLEVHDESGDAVSKSEDHVVVSLPEGGKEQPLVVLNTPAGPSDILQKPAAEQQVAAAAPEPQAQDSAEALAPSSVVGTADPETTVAARTTSEENQAGSDSAQQTTAQPAAPSVGPEQQQPVAALSERQQDTQPAAPAAQEEGVAAVADDPAVAGTSSELGAAETVAAGAANTDAGAPVDQTRTASAVPAVADEAGSPDVSAVQEDVPSSGEEVAGHSGAETAAASETRSEAAEPAPQTAAVTPNTSNEPESEAVPSDTAPASTAEADADAATPAQAAPAEPTVTVEAVESEKDKVYVAGTGEPGASIRVYVGEDFQGETQVNTSGKWLVQGSKNIAEGNVEVRADLIAEDGSSVDARAAVTFEKEQDKQIVLTKVIASGASGEVDGEGAEVKKALPVVIIRKGDNLWRISRRLYGQGVRYTTIYQANQDQIRNPDLIYPGQVVLTPSGDLNWKQPAGNNG